MKKGVENATKAVVVEKKNKFDFSKFGTFNVFLLGLVSFLNDFSSELIWPILPLLISSLGGTGLIIGIIGGFMDGFPNLIKVFSGYFSDKAHNRMKFIFGGYFLAEISKLMLYFANGWLTIMAFMGINKLGKGIREAPRDALISQSMPTEKGRGFGIQRAFDIGGAILGSIVLLAIVHFLGLHFKPLILLAAVLGFTSLIPIYFLKNIDNKSNGKEKKIFFFSSLRHLSSSLKSFIFIAVIFALANFTYMFFVLKTFSIFSSEIGNDQFTMPILLYVFFNIFYAGFAIPFGKWSDKIGRRRIIAAGYFLFSLVCAGFLFFSSMPMLILMFVLYGLSNAMVVSNQRAFVSDCSSEELRATAIGAFQTAIGISAIFAGVIGGILFDINQDYTFIYGFALSLFAAFAMIVFRVYYGNSCGVKK
ncbi:MAG: MFS transporter [Nanoarchaeota archaeon]